MSPVVGILKMADGSDRRAGTMELRRRPTPNFSAVQYRGGVVIDRFIYTNRTPVEEHGAGCAWKRKTNFAMRVGPFKV